MPNPHHEERRNRLHRVTNRQICGSPDEADRGERHSDCERRGLMSWVKIHRSRRRTAHNPITDIVFSQERHKTIELIKMLWAASLIQKTIESGWRNRFCVGAARVPISFFALFERWNHHRGPADSVPCTTAKRRVPPTFASYSNVWVLRACVLLG